MLNTILHSDRTLKNIVAVDEATARSAECLIDILDTDIFIENAPPIPDGMHTPQLLEDGSGWIEADQAAADARFLAQSEAAVRTKRDNLLAECDYVMMPDYTLPDKSPWVAYRQSLRDITLQAGFPDNIEWPVKPI